MQINKNIMIKLFTLYMKYNISKTLLVNSVLYITLISLVVAFQNCWLCLLMANCICKPIVLLTVQSAGKNSKLCNDKHPSMIVYKYKAGRINTYDQHGYNYNLLGEC